MILCPPNPPVLEDSLTNEDWESTSQFPCLHTCRRTQVEWTRDGGTQEQEKRGSCWPPDQTKWYPRLSPQWHNHGSHGSSLPGSASLSFDKVITVVVKACTILKIWRTLELSHGQIPPLSSDSEYVSIWVGRHSETHLHTYTFHVRAVCSTSLTWRGRKMVF